MRMPGDDRARITRGETYVSTSAATRTATTPLQCRAWASKNAANGVSTLRAPSSSGASIRRRTSVTTAPTSNPAAIPPTYDDKTAHQGGRADRGATGRDGDGHSEQRKGGAVVDDALRAQHGQGPAATVSPGPLPRPRRSGRALLRDRRRMRFHSERLGRQRHCHCGRDHQADTEQHDDAKVRGISRKLGVEALPVQDRRQEQQQHDLTVDPDSAEPGISPSRAPNKMSKTGGPPGMVRRGSSHDHDRHERNDNYNPNTRTSSCSSRSASVFGIDWVRVQHGYVRSTVTPGEYAESWRTICVGLVSGGTSKTAKTSV